MACPPAPTCKAALAEASRLFPKRSRASDGICPSAAHQQQNPNSDHDFGNAFDVTHDPANGCDAGALAESIRRRRDPRVKYVIWNRRMFSSYATSSHPAWTWRPYGGDNPHTKHFHVSIHKQYRDSTGPWFDLSTKEAHMPLIRYADGQRAIAVAVRPQADGYWLLASDGGVFAMGAAPFVGNLLGKLSKPVKDMEAWPDGNGLIVTTDDGAVFALGSAKFYGGAN